MTSDFDSHTPLPTFFLSTTYWLFVQLKWSSCSLFPVSPGVGQNVQDKDSLGSVVDPGDQTILIGGNVENRSAPDQVSAGARRPWNVAPTYLLLSLDKYSWDGNPAQTQIRPSSA